eukprot:scaffold52888_cov70-Phaeocystis_antarctica.AAC.15
MWVVLSISKANAQPGVLLAALCAIRRLFSVSTRNRSVAREARSADAVAPSSRCCSSCNGDGDCGRDASLSRRPCLRCADAEREPLPAACVGERVSAPTHSTSPQVLETLSSLLAGCQRLRVFDAQEAADSGAHVRERKRQQVPGGIGTGACASVDAAWVVLSGAGADCEPRDGPVKEPRVGERRGLRGLKRHGIRRRPSTPWVPLRAGRASLQGPGGGVGLQCRQVDTL